MFGAVTDGVHPLVGGAQAVVHDDAGLDRDAGPVGQPGLGAHPGGHHYGVDGAHRTVVAAQAHPRVPRRRPHPEPDVDPEPLQRAGEHRARARVELAFHQVADRV